jgi:excinuclease UvrABC ATPase subunit
MVDEVAKDLQDTKDKLVPLVSKNDLTKAVKDKSRLDADRFESLERDIEAFEKKIEKLEKSGPLAAAGSKKTEAAFNAEILAGHKKIQTQLNEWEQSTKNEIDNVMQPGMTQIASLADAVGINTAKTNENSQNLVAFRAEVNQVVETLRSRIGNLPQMCADFEQVKRGNSQSLDFLHNASRQSFDRVNHVQSMASGQLARIEALENFRDSSQSFESSNIASNLTNKFDQIENVLRGLQDPSNTSSVTYLSATQTDLQRKVEGIQSVVESFSLSEVDSASLVQSNLPPIQDDIASV